MGKLQAEEFIGLAKILCVHIFDNDNKDEKGKLAPRQAEEIIEDCLIAFDKLNRAKRREILRVVRAAVKGK
jgi:hypothetical protein